MDAVNPPGREPQWTERFSVSRIKKLRPVVVELKVEKVEATVWRHCGAIVKTHSHARVPTTPPLGT